MPGRFDNQIRSAIDHYGWDGVEQDELHQKLRDLQYMDQDINDYFAPEEEVDEFDQKLAMFGREDMPSPGYMESIQTEKITESKYLFKDKDGEPIGIGDSFTYLARQEPPLEYTVTVERIKNRVYLIFNDGRKVPFRDFFYGPMDKPLSKKIQKIDNESSPGYMESKKITEFEIKKKGDKWQVVGHGGDVKGTHDTEQQAKDQIAAIYASGYKKKEAAVSNEKLTEGVEDIINELTNLFIDDGSLKEEDSDQFVEFLLTKDESTLHRYIVNPQIAYDDFAEETDYSFPDEVVYSSKHEKKESTMDKKKMDEAELFGVGDVAKMSPVDESVKKQMYSLGEKAADMFSDKLFDMARQIVRKKADAVNYEYGAPEDLEDSSDFYDLVYELSDHFLSGMSDNWMFSFKDQ